MENVFSVKMDIFWLKSNFRFCENNNNKEYYYLYNEELKLYKNCGSEILNCQKCSSEINCILCSKGFKLIKGKNGETICMKEDESSSPGIILIPFICFVLLLIVAGYVNYLFKNKKFKKNDNNTLEDNNTEVTVNKNNKNTDENEENNIVIEKILFISKY